MTLGKSEAPGRAVVSQRGAMEILRGSRKEMGRETKYEDYPVPTPSPFPLKPLQYTSKDTKVSCFDGGRSGGQDGSG